MSTDETALKVVRYNAAETLLHEDDIKTVYLASHQPQQDNPWYSPAKFWERLEELYAPIPDFELVAGWCDGQMAGYAFGTSYRRPKEVRAKAVQVFPELAAETADAPVYIFREFSVHPDHQGQGYARIIHDALLSERPERLAYLLVRVENPAKSIYESWGWQAIGQAQPFADSPVMDEMAKRLA
ncbi:GNAT family N-acetyltransferase [Nocardia sp. NPDC051052]|uniref:GNAT family N-acetyltransferase n=1 Tax=Nocardia sp. NPDC051052 TaxID=3364322 RepID=UPI0037A30F2C